MEAAAIRSVQVGSASTPGQRTSQQPADAGGTRGPTPPTHSTGQLQLTQTLPHSIQALHHPSQRGILINSNNPNIAVPSIHSRIHQPQLPQGAVGVPPTGRSGGGGSTTSQQQIISGNGGAFSAYVGPPPPQSREAQASIRYLHTQPQAPYGFPFRDVYVRNQQSSPANIVEYSRAVQGLPPQQPPSASQSDNTMVDSMSGRNPRLSLSSMSMQQSNSSQSQQQQQQSQQPQQHPPAPTQNHTNSMDNRHVGTQQQQQQSQEYSTSSINSRDSAANLQQQRQQQQNQQTNAPQPPDPGGIVNSNIMVSNSPSSFKKIRLDESGAHSSNIQQTQTHIPLLPAHIPLHQPIQRTTPPTQQQQQSQQQQQPPSSQQQQQSQQKSAPSATSSSSTSTTTTTNSNSQPTTTNPTPGSLSTGSLPQSTALKIDIRDTPPQSGAYHPQVEAISPTPNELRATKDDLLTQINKVDAEITKTEKSISLMKEKRKALEKSSAQKPSVNGTEENSEQPATKHRNLAQQIYAENRKRAATAHAVLATLNATLDGNTFDLPLYNQPQDSEACKQVQQKHLVFKSSLILHLRKIKSERSKQNHDVSERYAQMQQSWMKRVEKIENSMKKKTKEAKNREFFEKVFPELRKQREDKERFNRVGSRVKSEADLEEIMDGLQEQEREDQKMRSYAVIPPLMLDKRQRRLIFKNENGALIDMDSEFENRENLNMWTTGEKEIFKEKFLQHPKNFGAIAACLDRKSAQDCVRHYYLSKKQENYKQLLRKSRQRTRSSRNPQKTNQNQSQCIVDSLTSGVTTRLQREQQQKSGRDRTSASSSSVNSANVSAASASANTSTSNSVTASILAITVSNNTQNCEIVKEETQDPLCTKSCTNTTPTLSSKTSSNSSNVNSSNDTSSITSSSNASIETSFVPNVHLNSSSSTSILSTTSASLATTTSSTTTISTPSSSSLIATKLSNKVLSSFAASSNQPQTSTSTSIATAAITTTTSTTTLSSSSALNSLDELKKEPSLLIPATGSIDIKQEPLTAEDIIIKKEIHDNSMDLKKMDGIDADNEIPTTIIMTNKVLIKDENIKLENDGDLSKSRKRKSTDMVNEDSSRDKIQALHSCFVCKKDLNEKTLAMGKDHFRNEDFSLPPSARLCISCQNNSITPAAYTNCPIGSCVNPKDRLKKLRNLPARLFDLPQEMRDPILKELKIPMDATKCCSACLIRVRRKMITHVLGPTVFTEDEIQQFYIRLREVGPQWSLLAELMGKTIAVLKLFYSFNKKKFGLDQAVNEYYKLHAREDRRPALSDGDESDVSVTSSDESEHNTKMLSSNSSNLEKQPTTAASSINVTTTTSQSVVTIPPVTTSSVTTTGSSGATTITASSDLDTTHNKTIANNNSNASNNNNNSNNNSSNLNLLNLNNKIEDFRSSKTGNVVNISNNSNNNSDNKGMCLMMKAAESNLIPNNNNNNNSKDLRVPTQPPFILSSGLMAVPINSLSNQQQPVLVRNKRQSEDYDSSATETADEESGSSPADRQSPKVPSAYSKLPPQSSISMIPQSQMPNGPFSSVGDVIVNVIERGVKNSMNNVVSNKHMAPLSLMKPQSNNNSQQNSDVTIVGEYRNDNMPMNKNQLRPPPSESLATLSVVNSSPQQPPPQLISQHTIGISPQIAATITPVPPPSQQQQIHQQQQQQRAQDNSRLSGPGRNNQMQMNEPEQAFDLSIKKPQQQDRPSFPPPSHTKSIPPPPPGNSAMYRGDPSIQVTNPSQNIPNATYHHYLDISRHPSKSPQTYINTTPMPRVLQQQTPPPISSQNKSKVAPKLSPKIQTSVTQMNGPKGGSITHGTPLNTSGQPIIIGSSTTLSPRFEAYKQPSPSSGNEKIGSITQGTPVVLPTLHLPDKRSNYDYYKNPRQSPAQQSQGGQSQQPPTSSASPHSVQQQFGAPFARQPGSVNAPLYPLDPQPQPQSTKQLLVNDYITSQQMHGQSRGMSNSINLVNITNSRGEKESPSPRSMASPAQIYYASDKDRERVATGQTRAEYMSRTSPADHVNSSPSPHRTPPPQQRQGVIQRHNAGNASGNKSPSPANRHLPPHAFLPTGHDAFSSLVEAAVLQPSLPVPSHKDSDSTKRSQITVTITDQLGSANLPPPHPYMSRDFAIHQQLQQQHQQRQQQIELIRRQQGHQPQGPQSHHSQISHNHAAAAAYREQQQQHHQQMVDRDRERREEHYNRERQIAAERERISQQQQHIQQLQDREREEQDRRAGRLILETHYPRYDREAAERHEAEMERRVARPKDSLTAANLIDAIITHQITSTDPPRYKSSRSSNMLSANESNSKSHSPNVINVDLDSDSKPPIALEQRITLGELADSIIQMQAAQVQGGPPQHLRYNASKTPPTGPPNPMHNQDSIMATDQWKYNRKIQQQQQHQFQQHQQQQQQQQQQQAAQKQKEEMQNRSNSNCGRPSSASDDRQIIRMAQTPSPRSKSNYQEPASPPAHFYLPHPHMMDRGPPNAGHPQLHSPALLMQNKSIPFPMDHYVKNRIAEAMRTAEEGGSSSQELNDKEHLKNSSPADAIIIDEDRPKSGHNPQGGVGSDNNKTSAKLESIYGQSPQHQSRPSSQPPPLPFTTHPYPYSALNVAVTQSGAPPPMTVQITKTSSNMDDQLNRQTQSMDTTKPLLSDQYEALSDED